MTDLLRIAPHMAILGWGFVRFTRYKYPFNVRSILTNAPACPFLRVTTDGLIVYAVTSKADHPKLSGKKQKLAAKVGDGRQQKYPQKYSS